MPPEQLSRFRNLMFYWEHTRLEYEQQSKAVIGDAERAFYSGVSAAYDEAGGRLSSAIYDGSLSLGWLIAFVALLDNSALSAEQAAVSCMGLRLQSYETGLMYGCNAAANDLSTVFADVLCALVNARVGSVN